MAEGYTFLEGGSWWLDEYVVYFLGVGRGWDGGQWGYSNTIHLAVQWDKFFSYISKS